MNCEVCQSPFICKVNESCWCNKLPKIITATAASCLCYDCLIKKMAVLVNEESAELDTQQKKEIKQLGIPQTLIQDIDYTVEMIAGEGKYVFSKWYLLRRGYCCDNNCRNCPYPK